MADYYQIKSSLKKESLIIWVSEFEVLMPPNKHIEFDEKDISEAGKTRLKYFENTDNRGEKLERESNRLIINTLPHKVIINIALADGGLSKKVDIAD